MLMEGAFTSGLVAANHILGVAGLALEPVESVPERGVMAGMPWPPARERWVAGARALTADGSERAQLREP